MVWGAGRRLVWCVENPREGEGTGEERLGRYRRVRDALGALIAAELFPGAS